MGLMDFIRKELIEIIEFTDDSRDTLSWRFPDDDKEIKNGAQLIVRESQVAQFVYLGEFGDTFGPGKHTLTTDNIPILTNLKNFLKEGAGTDNHFRLDEFQDTMRSRIVSVFTDALATAKVPALDVASRYSELGDALLPLLNPTLIGKYGIELASFIVENVSVPPEVEQAIDKRSSMAVVGNLNDYVKFQMAESMGKEGAGSG